uniref:Uncharacterized protein n=1 Tax=Setaria viridis TaxID=4556 RepID=A0A4U6SWE9_SETVI|nr:uncharacterized protein LOC117840233 [Setaria viridis]TKV93307.1 hypothetical protein SEVIR_9G217500v2 [Setaria viridis]
MSPRPGKCPQHPIFQLQRAYSWLLAPALPSFLVSGGSPAHSRANLSPVLAAAASTVHPAVHQPPAPPCRPAGSNRHHRRLLCRPELPLGSPETAHNTAVCWKRGVIHFSIGIFVASQLLHCSLFHCCGYGWYQVPATESLWWQCGTCTSSCAERLNPTSFKPVYINVVFELSMCKCNHSSGTYRGR